MALKSAIAIRPHSDFEAKGFAATLGGGAGEQERPDQFSPAVVTIMRANRSDAGYIKPGCGSAAVPFPSTA
ncbi:hypothetical protein ACVIHD_003470 [Bradyrhizobium embrapense]